MSLPTPHIQSMSSYRSEWRASSTNRNVSSPYSLAIPQRSQKRERADTPTQYIDPPQKPNVTKSTAYLEVPQSPKKAVTVTEKPVCPKLYTFDSKSTSTISSQYQHSSPYSLGVKPPKPKTNDHVLAFAVTFGIAVLLAIVVPIAAILPQKYIKPLPVQALVPFYINPEEESWGRLYAAIVKHHDTNFTVIVNPSDGPSNMTWPSATYIAAVKALTIYPNVRTLGYIDTAHGTISSTSVRAQIATYAGWKNVSDGLAMHGIYFDQTPWQDDEDGVAKVYLRNVSATVRHTNGWAGVGEGLVVHNPGRVPDKELMAYRPDLVVVYEGTYNDMPSRDTLHGQLAGAKGHREDFAMLVHSVPKELGRGGLRKIVEKVKKDVQWLYLTDLAEDLYTGYGSILEDWLGVSY